MKTFTTCALFAAAAIAACGSDSSSTSPSGDDGGVTTGDGGVLADGSLASKDGGDTKNDGGVTTNDGGGSNPDSGPTTFDGGDNIPDSGIVVAPLPMQSGTGTFTIPGRSENAIQVDLPSPMPPNPPIIISFHATDGDPSGGIGQADGATAKGAVVIAPSAGYRNGAPHPGDVDHEQNQTGSSWNMWDLDPSTNEDLRYVLSLIASAKQYYKADTSRVYTMGYSNGAFMAYFVAASLPHTIAGFAESSGGWTTDSCPTRYGADQQNLSFYPTSGPAAGVSIPCSTLYASSNPPFPTSCRPTSTNHLRPPTPNGRVPFGYLAHYASDGIVSVQWSCFLADVMGSRAQITVRWSDSDGSSGHNFPPDFFSKAWAFWANRTNAQ